MVNGDVKATDLTADAVALTIKGSINISTAGSADARTVNGSIRATIGSADWDGEAAFETVNGSITLLVPETIDADLSVRTVNGSIKSELEMTDVHSSRRRLEGQLGRGGRDLHVKPTNGSVRLLQAD